MTFPFLPNIPGLPQPPKLPNILNVSNLLNPQKIVESIAQPPMIRDILEKTGLPPPQKIVETLLNFRLPTIPGLPTPQDFIGMFFNITSDELNDLVSDFNFDELPAKDVMFLLHLEDGSNIVLNASNLDQIKTTEPMKFISNGWGGKYNTCNCFLLQIMTMSYHLNGFKALWSSRHNSLFFRCPNFDIFFNKFLL